MRSPLRIHVWKELRELLPWWAGAIATMLVYAALGRSGPFHRGLFSAACLVYAAASVSLGALSIGHEYAHRTLGALLAQPIDRRRLLATKFAALMPLLVTLTTVAAVTLGSDRSFDATRLGVDPSFY